MAPQLETFSDHVRAVHTWAARGCAKFCACFPVLCQIAVHRPADRNIGRQSGQGARAGCVDAIQSTHVSALRPLRKAEGLWWLTKYRSSEQLYLGEVKEAGPCRFVHFLEVLQCMR